MPTVDDILRAQRRQSIFDRVSSGSSSSAPAPAAPSVFDRLSQGLSEPLPMEGRLSFLPAMVTPERGREWAVPGVLAGAWNAFTAPGRALQGQEVGPDEALNVAGMVMSGGMPMAPTGYGIAGMAAKGPPSKPPEYRGTHTAPLKDSGAPLHDLTGGGTVYPDDVYSINAARYYGHGDPAQDARLFQKIHALRDKPDEMVDIFRAVPKEAFIGGKQPKFEHGDWVTISREYAKQHGESTLNGEYKIMRARVPAKSLFTNGDSPYEFGLDRSVLGKE